MKDEGVGYVQELREEQNVDGWTTYAIVISYNNKLSEPFWTFNNVFSGLKLGDEVQMELYTYRLVQGDVTSAFYWVRNPQIDAAYGGKLRFAVNFKK